jgi:hexosaminidase
VLFCLRHFLPTNALRRQIDGLSYTKMNYLHWHMTDAQSTPFDSATFPKLKNGAFSPALYYTPQDVRDIVEYARVRGVEVLVEVDMPGA